MGVVKPRRGHTERPFGGVHGRIGAADGVLCLALRRRVPAFCEVARAACDTTAGGSLPHGLWGARAGPGLAIRAGVLAATGAAVADESLGLLGRGRAGRSSILFLTTVGHQKDGGAAAFCAGSAGKGAWGVWGVDDRLGAAIRGRQAASKADTVLFLSFSGGTKYSMYVCM